MQYFMSSTSYIITKIIWYGDKDIWFTENRDFYLSTFKDKHFSYPNSFHIVEYILKIETERKDVTIKQTNKQKIPKKQTRFWGFFFLYGARLSTEEGKEKPSWSLLLNRGSNLHHYQSRKLLPHHVCVHDIYLLVIIMFSVLRYWVINSFSVWH